MSCRNYLIYLTEIESEIKFSPIYKELGCLGASLLRVYTKLCIILKIALQNKKCKFNRKLYYLKKNERTQPIHNLFKRI
jgi:hypothetical protein